MRICTDSQKIIEKMQLFDKRIGQMIPFKLWDRQVEFLDLIHTERLVCLLKKRQVGMSQLTGADSLVQSMIIPGFLTLVLSKTGGDAREYLRRISDMYNSLDKAYRACFPLKGGTHSLDKMEFENGSRILSLSANLGAGYTCDRIIVDEAAKITTKAAHIELSQVLMNVQPTLDKSKGQLVLITTAEGINEFQQIFIKATNYETRWKSFFFSCWDDPTFKKEDREQIIIDHGDDHANQEYPRTWKEAFLSAGFCRMPVKVLDAWYTENTQPIFIGEITNWETIENEKEPLSLVELKEKTNGGLRVYEELEPEGQYAFGVDTAEGVRDETISGIEGRDWNVCEIFNAKTWSQVAIFRSQCDPDVFGGYVASLAHYYNEAFVLPERNTHGGAFITSLVKYRGYKKVFRELPSKIEQEIARKAGKNPRMVLGWYNIGKKREELLDEIRRSIRLEECRLYDRLTITEFMNFIETGSGKEEAGPGFQDDCVIASMLALKACKLSYRRPLTAEEKYMYEHETDEMLGSDGYGANYERR